MNNIFCDIHTLRAWTNNTQATGRTLRACAEEDMELAKNLLNPATAQATAEELADRGVKLEQFAQDVWNAHCVAYREVIRQAEAYADSDATKLGLLSDDRRRLVLQARIDAEKTACAAGVAAANKYICTRVRTP